MKNWTVGRKIGLGFGLVIILLIAVATLSYSGINGIVSNAEEVIFGNRLDGGMAQKEVDHLNWVNEVNALLTDEKVTKLDVQMDHTKCAFGTWLYGEERAEAERHVHGLGDILKQIEEPHKHLHESAADIKKHFQQADATLPGRLAERINDHLNWANAIRDGLLSNAEAVKVETDPTKCALGRWLATDEAKQAYNGGTPQFRKAWDQMLSAHGELHNSAKAICDGYAQVHPGLQEILLSRLVDHKNWAEKVTVAVIEGNKDLGVETDPTRCAFGKFLDSDQCRHWLKTFPAFKSAVDEGRRPHKELHESAIAISAALAKGETGHAEAGKILKTRSLPALEKVSTCFDHAIAAEQSLIAAQDKSLTQFNQVTLPVLHKTVDQLTEMKTAATHAVDGMTRANGIYAQQTVPNLKQVQGLLAKARKAVGDSVMSEDVMLGRAEATQQQAGLVATFGLVLGAAFAVFIVRSITKALKQIIEGLTSAAEQVSAASSQVSSSSQQLAQGSSEQASSLEETSASLEEMSSMTKQNAANAKQANALSSEAMQSTEQGAEAMGRMSDAIGKIKQSSDETARIIKVIDEIAFQTNLLALNAAVEAARAGDAGKGFAVVAEEVRNLAQRSAEAAKNTADLIDGAQQNAENGVKVTEDVTTILGEVTGGVRKVTDLLGEVSGASDEQSRGVEQINVAVGQMDQVTQQVAANAEESAAASEELSAQAVQLNDMVVELAAMVGGSRAARPNNASVVGQTTQPRRAPATQQTRAATSSPTASRAAAPESVIPLNCEEEEAVLSEF